MIVISTREFRAKQSMYLDIARKGTDVVLKSREKGSFKLVPVTGDDTLMSKEEFLAKIEMSARQIRDGKGIRQRDNESVEQFLDRMLCTE